ELITGSCERKRDVRVQALECPSALRCAADPEVELRTQPTLLGVGALEARRERRLLPRRARPPVDAAVRLEARHLGDQVRTREPVGRRERRAGVVVRLLLGYGRTAEGTTDGDAPKRARLTSKLSSDDLAVIFHRRRL